MTTSTTTSNQAIRTFLDNMAEPMCVREVAEALGAGISHVRTVAFKHGVKLPRMFDRLKVLKGERDRMVANAARNSPGLRDKKRVRLTKSRSVGILGAPDN